MATISERFKRFILNIFRIREFQNQYFNIDRRYSFQANAAKNQLWYDGDSYELKQFYSQAGESNQNFWGSSETRGSEIRRIHTGLPALMVDSLVNITAGDLDDISFINEEKDALWNEIRDKISFDEKIAELTKTALIIGDGAVKLTYDIDTSATPFIEVVPGQDVDYIYTRNKLSEIKFYTHYNVSGTDYTLEETYGYGYITYKLYKGEHEVSLKSILQTSDLEDVTFDDSIMLAVPFKFFNSTRYKERGKSVYEGKIDSFDALDECISQWMDAVRAGRTKTYIPQTLIPMDMNGGYLMRPNAFDNRFIQVADNYGNEKSNSMISTVQPEIRTDAYMQTYITLLDMALQGVISPSTLGIDSKKLDNAEAQREKEKATLYTRAAVIKGLTGTIKDLVQAVFDTMAIMYGTAHEDVEIEINFGEYANPSFEAVVETMSNPNAPMSIEARVEELWGASKTDEWKAEEVKRIKNERGIVDLDEPALSEDVADLLEDTDDEEGK